MIEKFFEKVMDFKKINDIVATETLMEMEVDLGW